MRSAPWPGAGPSVGGAGRGGGRGIAHRLGTADRADAGGVVHVQRHVALELQRALDHRAGPDDDALAPRAEPDRHPVAARLADPHAAVHVRADADGEVAVGHVDVAPDFGRDQADGAVGIADIAADLAAAADQHAAVDGFDAARDPRALADADAAIDRGQTVACDSA